jgi:hypothetical protein
VDPGPLIKVFTLTALVGLGAPTTPTTMPIMSSTERMRVSGLCIIRKERKKQHKSLILLLYLLECSSPFEHDTLRTEGLEGYPQKYMYLPIKR